MRRTYVGPFHRFAFEQQGEGTFVIFDAEAGMLAQPVATVATEAAAHTYIEAAIAADPTMVDGDD